MSSGIRTGTIQAPSWNLVTPTTIATTPVARAPTPLMASAPPAGLLLAQPPPVHDHARLAEGEGHEHADRVERDQVGDAAAEGEISSAATSQSTMMPPVKARRSPRNGNRRGR